MTKTTKEPQNLGFEDAFDQVKPARWPLPEKSISNDREVDTADLKKVAEATGFVSGQVQTPKEPTDQINFRAKVSTIGDFRCALQSAGTKLALWIWPGTGSCSPKTRTATKPCPPHEAVGCWAPLSSGSSY